MTKDITTEINGKTIHEWKLEAEIEKAEADRLSRRLANTVAAFRALADAVDRIADDWPSLVRRVVRPAIHVITAKVREIADAAEDAS